MTLYVHRSQRVEDLARSLANVVREGFPADPFASLPIVVGSRGMERWLRVELARELGAVMGIAFPFPEPAFDGATRVLLEGADWAEIGARDPRREADPWDDAALGFRVVTALRELAADPDLEEVRRYLKQGGSQGAVSARELTFALELADVINRLMHHRADDAVAWQELPEAAPEAHRWIAKVLAHLASEDPGRSPAHRHLALREAARTLAAGGSVGAARGVVAGGSVGSANHGVAGGSVGSANHGVAGGSVGAALRGRPGADTTPTQDDPHEYTLSGISGNMPENGTFRTICIFGLSTLGVGDRERLELLARAFDIHLFVLAPSSAWWADFRTKASLRRRTGWVRDAESEAELVAEVTRQNALLTGLGEPSRWIQAWLEATQYQDGEVPAPISAPTSESGDEGLLHGLQRWVDEAGEMPSRGEALFAYDRTLAFHAAHGALRQCEVLRDELLHAFEEDPTLEPGDILVMTPDVETYAPLVAAVFSRRGTDKAKVPAIPVSIADLGLRATNPVAEVLLAVLTLARERVTATALLGFLGLAPVRERFSLSEDDLADLRELVVSSGLRWAWDAADRARHGQPALIQNTVRFAIERLAMGVLMPEPGPLEVVQGVVPLPVHSRDRVARFGKLATICRALEGTRELLSSAATTTEWRARLVAVIERFTPVGPSRIAVVERLEAALPDQPDKADEPDEPDTLLFEREAVQRVVEGAFEDRARGDRPVTGAVTVCALEPMRSVPFRVIALLGMDDGVFPRSPKMRSWDPFAERRPGELDRRAVDRHLVLEALLSARDRLMVLWTGFEPKRGQAQPACVVVEELLDVVARLTGKTRDALVTNHPLQPWSTRSFVGERPSYDAIMASAASALVGPRSSTGLWNEAGEANALGDEVPVEISAEALARALAEPQRHLLKDRLGLELDPREVEVLDREPIELDALDQWKVRDPVVRQMVASDTPAPEGKEREKWICGIEERSVDRLAGEGLLPLAHAGRRVIADTVGEAEELRQLWLEATGTREPGRLVSVDVDGCVVTGRAPRWLREGDEVWLEWTLASKLSSKHKLIAWVEVLVAKLVHPEVAGARIVAWRAEKKENAGPVEEARLVAPGLEVCREHLATLLAVWREVRRSRVALFPKLSAALGEGKWGDAWVEKGRSSWDRDQDDLWVMALWGELALADLAKVHGAELVDLAMKVWGPVLSSAPKTTKKAAPDEGEDMPKKAPARRATKKGAAQ